MAERDAKAKNESSPVSSSLQDLSLASTVPAGGQVGRKWPYPSQDLSILAAHSLPPPQTDLLLLCLRARHLHASMSLPFSSCSHNPTLPPSSIPWVLTVLSVIPTTEQKRKTKFRGLLRVAQINGRNSGRNGRRPAGLLHSGRVLASHAQGPELGAQQGHLCGF